MGLTPFFFSNAAPQIVSIHRSNCLSTRAHQRQGWVLGRCSPSSGPQEEQTTGRGGELPPGFASGVSLAVSLHFFPQTRPGNVTNAPLHLYAAGQHPQRGTDYAPARSPQYCQADRIFRIPAILLHHSRALSRRRAIPSDRSANLL